MVGMVAPRTGNSFGIEIRKKSAKQWIGNYGLAVSAIAVAVFAVAVAVSAKVMVI